MNDFIIASDGRIEAHNEEDATLLLRAGLICQDKQLEDLFGDESKSYYSLYGESTWEDVDKLLRSKYFDERAEE